MINLASQWFVIEKKNAVYESIEAVLKEYEYWKQIIKNHFSKNLVMSAEDEKRFQSSNKCWICNKLFIEEDKKVTGHDHITRKYKGSAHSNSNINLK